jgi:hypothetical protein
LAQVKATLAAEDTNDCLTLHEFSQIKFKNILPSIITDLITYLIGRPYQGYGTHDDEDAP